MTKEDIIKILESNSSRNEYYDCVPDHNFEDVADEILKQVNNSGVLDNVVCMCGLLTDKIKFEMGKKSSKCDCCGDKCIDFWTINSSREHHLLGITNYEGRFPSVCSDCSSRATDLVVAENRSLKNANTNVSL